VRHQLVNGDAALERGRHGCLDPLRRQGVD
jgi:hypothetical protein